MIWFAVTATGLSCLFIQWDRVRESTSQVVSGYNWIYLIGTWLLLKVMHETAHGVACRKHGIAVREAGVLLLLLMPLPYVDVTSAWRLQSRFKRILISAAGMYIELFVAGLAMIWWYTTDSPLIRQHTFNVAFTASVVTLLFNANPLMRFDGYYMLTDWLEMPNLATHGQQILKSAGRRLFWALKGTAPRWPEGRGWLIVSYGVAALLWRVLICVGLIVIAFSLLRGLGILLAAFGLLVWLVIPLSKALVFTVVGSETETPSRIRVIVVNAAIATALFAIFSLPAYRTISAPAVVDYYPIEEVRTSVAGFVHKVNARSGQSVRAGDVLLRLDNPELRIDHRRLKDALEQSQQRQRIYHSRERIAAWQAEVSAERALRQQLGQVEQRLNALTIVAPRDGVILDSNLTTLHGHYLRSGDRVLSLGASGDQKLVSLIAERDLDQFGNRLGQRLDVHIDGTDGRFSAATLQTLEPRASTFLPHHAFSAASGGELDVELADTSRRALTDQELISEELEPRLVAPRFVATLELPVPNLQAGRSGQVSFRLREGTLGQRLKECAIRWYQQRADEIDRATRSDS